MNDDDIFDGIGHGTSGGFNASAMQAAQDRADAEAQAQADLAKAEREAAALLAELEAKDAANSVASGVQPHKMPSPYAPGETPDPVKGVGEPEGYKNGLWNALDGNFKPVNLENLKTPTNTSSATIDFAQKIRDANKYGKK